MRGRLQIWLRVDQAECAVAALKYVIARFDENAAVTSQPAIKFGMRLARERASEVAAVIDEAIAKKQERA